MFHAGHTWPKQPNIFTETELFLNSSPKKRRKGKDSPVSPLPFLPPPPLITYFPAKKGEENGAAAIKKIFSPPSSYSIGEHPPTHGGREEEEEENEEETGAPPNDPFACNNGFWGGKRHKLRARLEINFLKAPGQSLLFFLWEGALKKHLVASFGRLRREKSEEEWQKWKFGFNKPRPAKKNKTSMVTPFIARSNFFELIVQFAFVFHFLLVFLFPKPSRRAPKWISPPSPLSFFFLLRFVRPPWDLHLGRREREGGRERERGRRRKQKREKSGGRCPPFFFSFGVGWKRRKTRMSWWKK